MTDQPTGAQTCERVETTAGSALTARDAVESNRKHDCSPAEGVPTWSFVSATVERNLR